VVFEEVGFFIPLVDMLVLALLLLKLWLAIIFRHDLLSLEICQHNWEGGTTERREIERVE
jgi:hypothetical protein